ncbi:Nuclear pore complex protein Nup85 [Acorus calamus]|uniref:Nuclear pore complex protein Nup85 n=1 Tax=Acorus calamus TaxID=4465 RepID=A0AAV9CJ13_ACOCL|nr:Nuclear pore complex protein Nup85 [Acorus calamus]
MPGMASDAGDQTMVPLSSEVVRDEPAVHPLRLGLRPPISGISISWSRGNLLRVASFRDHDAPDGGDGDVGGKVVEVRLGGRSIDGCGGVDEARRRRIAYGTEEFLCGGDEDVSVSLVEGGMKVEEPTYLKAAWELLEIFYVDKQSLAWLPERLVDWLADYDCLLARESATVHSNLATLQKKLVSLQVVEDDPEYWEGVSQALAIGWLEIVVKLLRLHGSYQLDQLGDRETENGLVETVAVLVSTMPRMRPDLPPGKLGQCYKTKPDFVKGLDGTYNLAQKCMQTKPMSQAHTLTSLLIGILGENTEVVLAECSKAFGPWMVVHAMELLTAENTQAEALLHEERYNLGGISIVELNRLVYAQVLSSEALTWQSLEICRLYELESTSSSIMKIAGMYHWKHGRKGSGIFWLQQARDEIRLSRIAQQLFDYIGKSISDDSFKMTYLNVE